VLARRVRQRVLAICDRLLETGIKGENERTQAEEEYWVRATRVEALSGLGRTDEADTAFETAKKRSPPPENWMIDSTAEQLAKLKALLKA
jgi:hypothetical protein